MLERYNGAGIGLELVGTAPNGDCEGLETSRCHGRDGAGTAGASRSPLKRGGWWWVGGFFAVFFFWGGGQKKGGEKKTKKLHGFFWGE